MDHNHPDDQQPEPGENQNTDNNPDEEVPPILRLPPELWGLILPIIGVPHWFMLRNINTVVRRIVDSTRLTFGQVVALGSPSGVSYRLRLQCRRHFVPNNNADVAKVKLSMPDLRTSQDPSGLYGHSHQQHGQPTEVVVFGEPYRFDGWYLNTLNWSRTTPWHPVQRPGSTSGSSDHSSSGISHQPTDTTYSSSSDGELEFRRGLSISRSQSQCLPTNQGASSSIDPLGTFESSGSYESTSTTSIPSGSSAEYGPAYIHPLAEPHLAASSELSDDQRGHASSSTRIPLSQTVPLSNNPTESHSFSSSSSSSAQVIEPTRSPLGMPGFLDEILRTPNRIMTYEHNFHSRDVAWAFMRTQRDRIMIELQDRNVAFDRPEDNPHEISIYVPSMGVEYVFTMSPMHIAGDEFGHGPSGRYAPPR